ncbi:MAG: hypothetical protein AAF682_11135 [Planctomycetota bacterium]
MREISNLGRSALGRAAVLLVPAICSFVALAGVTARPAIGLTAARAELEQATIRARRYRVEWAKHVAYRDVDAGARLAEAQARIDRMLPSNVGKLDLHTALRLAAELSSLTVSSLHLGDAEDVGLPRLGDLAVLQRVELNAEGELPDVFTMLSTLERLGLPVVVHELSLDRTQPSTQTFGVYLSLGIYQVVPLPEDDTAEARSEEQSP